MKKLKYYGLSELFDIKNYPFKKKVNDFIYYQEKNGWCSISQYDSNGNCIAYENSDGVIIIREFDEFGNILSVFRNKEAERHLILNSLLLNN